MTSGRYPPMPYDEEIGQYICVELALGRPVTKIVKDDGMPGLDTVYKWLRDNESFAEQYARARADQADTLGDETMEIADQVPKDLIGVQHQRLRVDTRKWFASKMLPRKYGEKIDHTSGGEKLPAGFNVHLGVTIDKDK